MNNDLINLNKRISSDLLPWFEQNQRPMPWRKNRTAYRVWISELMLQQTRVNQVIPYYLRFMEKFPSIKILALSDLQDVLKLWEGLGYYSRARNLHKAAKTICEKFGGIFPEDPDLINQLPGIGPYTTAAIASLAFNKDLAVVDGNVIRVLSRLLAIDSDVSKSSTKKELQIIADNLLVKGKAGKFNESMMELGATICMPKNPNCKECPVIDNCMGYKIGDPSSFPVKKKKAKIPHIIVGAAVVSDGNKVLISQRRENQMLGGLWEFPGGKKENNESIKECIARELLEELGIIIEIQEKIITVNHAYSHFTMEMHTYWAKIKSGEPKAIDCKTFKWVKLDKIRSMPFPKADIKVLDVIS